MSSPPKAAERVPFYPEEMADNIVKIFQESTEEGVKARVKDLSAYITRLVHSRDCRISELVGCIMAFRDESPLPGMRQVAAEMLQLFAPDEAVEIRKNINQKMN